MDGYYWFRPNDASIVSDDIIAAALVKKTSGAIHDFHTDCKVDFESTFHDDIIRLSIPYFQQDISSNPFQFTSSSIQAVLNVSVNISDTFGSIKTNFQKEYLPIVSSSSSSSFNHEQDAEYYYLDHIISQLKSIPFCRSRVKYEDYHHETPAVSTTTSKNANTISAIMKPSLTRVLILGDSHSSTFYYAAAFSAHYFSSSSSSAAAAAALSEESYNQCADSNYHVCPVFGASAYGLKNLNSATMSRKKFSSCLNQHGEQANYVAMMLGTNDVDFVARHRHVPILDQIKASIINLFEYVDKVLIKEHGFNMSQANII
jgi:hypothetical protein